jgi:DNA polymerase III delta prime subunit
MINSTFLNPLNSTKLISMDHYFDEMNELYNSKKFPKVMLLNGKKGLGKFTLIVHFLNYIFTKNEKNSYNLNEKIINTDSFFYNQLLNQTNQDVILIKAEENRNIKIEDIRNLKANISNSSLSKNPRFIVIDEVEFINDNSANALLKALEEPNVNNFFILINNQQANLIKTVSSRCLINNIFLSSNKIEVATNYLLKKNNIEDLLGFRSNLTPGLFLYFNDIYLKLSINHEDKILIKINKLLNAYKKNKVKLLITLTLFLIDQYFLELVQANEKKLDIITGIKSDIIKNINDFIHYNLNINSVLNSIEVKLKNA